MDFPFSSPQVTAQALSEKFRKSPGRNKLWNSIQREVKKRSKAGEKDGEKTFVMCMYSIMQQARLGRLHLAQTEKYSFADVDGNRGAGTSMGATDLNSDFKKKRDEEKFKGSMQDNLNWTIFYKDWIAITLLSAKIKHNSKKITLLCKPIA